MRRVIMRAEEFIAWDDDVQVRVPNQALLGHSN